MESNKIQDLRDTLEDIDAQMEKLRAHRAQKQQELNALLPVKEFRVSVNSPKVLAANARIIAESQVERGIRFQALQNKAGEYAQGNRDKCEAFLAGYQHALLPH